MNSCITTITAFIFINIVVSIMHQHHHHGIYHHHGHQCLNANHVSHHITVNQSPPPAATTIIVIIIAATFKATGFQHALTILVCLLACVLHRLARDVQEAELKAQADVEARARKHAEMMADMDRCEQQRPQTTTALNNAVVRQCKACPLHTPARRVSFDGHSPHNCSFCRTRHG